MWPSIVSKGYKYRILSLLFHTTGRLPYGEGHKAESQEPTTNKDPWNTSTNKKWEHAFVSIQVQCLQQAWSQSVSTSYRKMTRPKLSILPAPLPPTPTTYSSLAYHRCPTPQTYTSTYKTHFMCRLISLPRPKFL